MAQGSIIFYERIDWGFLKEHALDENFDGINDLVNSDNCQEISSPTVVRYLDPVGEHEALIKMPSGRGAFLMKKDLQAL